MTILDKIAVRDAMKHAKAATRQQVYVITGVIPDGKGFIANRVKHTYLTVALVSQITSCY